MPVDQVIWPDEVEDLKQLIVELDQILHKLVPQPYTQIKFRHIPEVFQHVLEEGQGISNKFGFRLDEQGYELYSYAQELSLADIEQLAQHAYQVYSNTGSEDEFLNAHQLVIDIKEAQYQYIYALNAEAFDKVQEILVTYLNKYQLTEDTYIQQIQTLQDKYQIKFVLFDEVNWLAQDLSTSGFKELHQNLSLLEADIDTEMDFMFLDYWRDEPLPSHSKESLSAIKQELNPSSRFKKGNRSLTRPPKQAKKDVEKIEAESNQDKKKSNKNIHLPDTGEMRRYSWLAIATLIPGLVLLGNHLVRKYKEKKKIDDIPFD